MEFFDGITLQNYINYRRNINKPFSEEECKDIISQLLQGIEYIHSQNVIHRDLKPENILIQLNEEEEDPLQLEEQRTSLFKIKIIDFGLSIKQEHIFQSDNVGTLLFQAPEITKNLKYTESIDMWSIGVI